VERVLPWADLFLKGLSVIALLSGGAWAVYQFYLRGATDWVVNLDITTETLPYRDNLKLLVIHVKAKNPTESEFNLDKPGASYQLALRKIPDSLKSGVVIDEKAGADFANINLLPVDGMDFVPGAELNETETVVVPTNSTISIFAEIRSPNGGVGKHGEQDYDFVNASRVVTIGGS
jgi:hypothetical protein